MYTFHPSISPVVDLIVLAIGLLALCAMVFVLVVGIRMGHTLFREFAQTRQVGLKGMFVLAIVFAVTVALVGHVATPVVSVVAGGAFLGLLGCVCAVEFLKGGPSQPDALREMQHWRVWRIYRRSQHEKAADTVLIRTRD